MTKKVKTIISAILLSVSLAAAGTIICKNKHHKTEQLNTLLSYSKADSNRISIELKQLKIRTYTDLYWGKDGRRKYFENWKNANEYGYLSVPSKCRVNYAILIVQASKITYADNCVITSGIWKSPYTNNLITTYTDIEIDHIVPLKDAWSSGANDWTQNERIKYANTENNLLISELSLNSKKGYKSPDKWLPDENKCGYITKWIDIKYNYKLTVTKNEHNTLKEQIEKCT